MGIGENADGLADLMASVEANVGGISTNSEDIVAAAATIGANSDAIAATDNSVKMLKTIAMLNW